MDIEDQDHPIVMSIYERGGDVTRRSLGRAVMFAGVLLAAAIWMGLVPSVSQWARQFDTHLRDQLSLILESPEAREDLVFLGMEGAWKEDEALDAETVRGSRALRLMSARTNNRMFDRRVFAELIEKLAGAGAKAIIFDVLFMGSSGDPAVDREFAAALNRHHDKIVLSVLLNPVGDGTYEPVSSVQELPLLSRAPERRPHEGYVNLWPDPEDGVVRRMVYTTSLGELETGKRAPYERVYESLSTVAARLMRGESSARSSAEAEAKKVNRVNPPRLRYAAAKNGEGESRFSAAYAPKSLHTLFVPERWRNDYADGEYFRDKVVLISTSTLVDQDTHHIPGAEIYGGQFHLQALGSLLDGNYWKRTPQWADIAALLFMAILAVAVGMALRHPLAILLAAIALGGGFVVGCAWLSAATGVLFAGTPGLLGLALVTVCAEVGQLIGRTGVREEDVAGENAVVGEAV